MFSTNPTVSLAFSLSLIASASSKWLVAAPVLKFPILPRMANLSATGVSLADGTQKYFADALCTPAQRVVEQIAWNDAQRYAQALASWRPNGSFQPAMDLYMGTDSDGPLSDVLEANINGALRDNHYLVFCPEYYTSDTPSLSQVITKVDRGLADSSIANTFTDNQGKVYFHESMHFADLTTAIGHDVVDNYLDEPSIYGPLWVAREAALENTAATIHIAAGELGFYMSARAD
ncbi:MAG: hypothetical protein Q9175_003029 [Cornicularia normoerica]